MAVIALDGGSPGSASNRRRQDGPEASTFSGPCGAPHLGSVVPSVWPRGTAPKRWRAACGRALSGWQRALRSSMLGVLLFWALALGAFDPGSRPIPVSPAAAETSAGAPANVAVPPASDGPLGSGLALAVGGLAVFGALYLAIRTVMALGAEPTAVATAEPVARATGADRRRPPALTLLARRASEAAGRTLQRRGLHERVDAVLEQAGIELRPGELAVIVAVASTGAGLLGTLLGGMALGFLLAALTAVGARFVVLRRRDRRLEAFDEQLPELLRILAAALRAGYALPQAVEAAALETESPSADELRRVTAEVRLGRDIVESLDAVATRMANDDLRWVTGAIAIHREIGGDLGHVMDAVQSTILARDHLRREVRSLSAEGRVSGVVLTILPIAVAMLQAIVNPGFLDAFTGSAFGMLVAIGTALLVTTGALWMRRIVRPEF